MNLTDGDRELLVIALDHYIATAMRSSQIEKLGSLIDKLEANEPDVAVVPNVVGVNMVELHDTIMSLIDSVSDRDHGARREGILRHFERSPPH